MTTTELARRIRAHGIRMNSTGGGSHTGAILSCADILAVLYGRVLKVFPERPKHPDRDRFVLSKGHACAGLYAALAETGFFPVEQLATHYQDGSLLCGHSSHKVPGVEVSTGALGHGLSISAGMAYAGALGGVAYRTFCLLGDGECDEGAVWEAALFAAHHRLDKLTAVIDCNRLQGIGATADILDLEPFPDKWRSFGWDVIDIDGHDHEGLAAALETGVPGRPRCVIARTTKGKGVSFMENSVLWHYRIPRGEELANALAEVESLA